MIGSNRTFCLHDQMVKCGLCFRRHYTKDTVICWNFSPAHELKVVRLLDQAIDFFYGLLVATLTQEHRSDNGLFSVKRLVFVFCPFFKDFPWNLCHQTCAITGKPIIIASTSVLVAIEGLNTLLKDVI
jgi:hypothetical protein